MEQWFAFRALNSQTLYGFGTDQQADKFTDHLNQRRKTDVYQPVDEVLVQSERRSKRIFTTIRAGMALWATRTMMRASYAPLLVGSRTRKHQPRATASFGVPAPMSRRISSPRLCPATWIR